MNKELRKYVYEYFGKSKLLLLYIIITYINKISIKDE